MCSNPTLLLLNHVLLSLLVTSNSKKENIQKCIQHHARHFGLHLQMVICLSVYKYISFVIVLDTSHPFSSIPIVAARRVANTLFSQHFKASESKASQTKQPSGKRLTSHTGLNITDNASIHAKLKENNDKKYQKQKFQSKKCRNKFSVSGLMTKSLKNLEVVH